MKEQLYTLQHPLSWHHAGQGPRTKDQHDLVLCEKLFVVDQDDGDLSGCMFMQI